MKKILLCYLLFFAAISAFAQDFETGKITDKELNLKTYSKDSAANAVVLQEFGNAEISNREHSPLVFQYHVKIKLFNSKAFDHGDVIIRLHKQDDREETVEKISGITFSKSENGNIESTELDPSKIYHENKSKYSNQVRFAMPGLKNGCVIEYSYTIVSPFVFNFRNWNFQTDIPKVYSEYIAHIPAIYNYNIVLRGGRKLSKNSAVLERECFTPGGGLKADCSQITYAMADIPAFVEEKYMTAPSNFISAMHFELSEYSDYQGIKHKLTINSYYCIVYGDHTRKRSIDPTFASLQGNHTILCLPFKNDTTWLECTSKETPFGFLGDFTDGRNVVACNENGGKLLRTPDYKNTDNLQTRNCQFSIDKNGMLTGKMETRFEGEQYDNREELAGESYQEQLKKLQQLYLIDNLNIKSFQLKQQKTQQPVTLETISLEAHDYCSLNNDQVIVPLNRVNFIKRPLKEIRNRTLPVCINHGYLDTDEIIYQLPEDYKIENRPRNVKVETPFGQYQSTIELKEGKLIYNRKLQLNAGTYPPETYHQLTDFYEQIFDADNEHFTLSKK